MHKLELDYSADLQISKSLGGANRKLPSLEAYPGHSIFDLLASGQADEVDSCDFFHIVSSKYHVAQIKFAVQFISLSQMSQLME